MTIVGGFEYDYYPGHIRDVRVAWASGSLVSGQGNYGMVVVPATASGLVSINAPLFVRDTAPSLVKSGKTTVAHMNQIWYGSSQICSRIWLNCASSCQFMMSGAEYSNGVKLQPNTVYDIPINNSDAFWLSGSTTTQDVYWTIFS